MQLLTQIFTLNHLSSGKPIWGGSDFEYIHSIQQTTDGEYIASRYSDSNDGDVGGNYDYYDYWVVKLDANLSVDDNLLENDIILYPTLIQ